MFKDLTNKIFGRLKAIRRLDVRDEHNQVLWECECQCEKKTHLNVPVRALTSGHRRSCGCLVHRVYPDDLTGMRFGELIVLRKSDRIGKNWTHYWWCKCCLCGKEIEVTRSSLISGSTTTCGNHFTNDLTGKVFGRLKVIRRLPRTDGNTTYECICQNDGNIVQVKHSSLISGSTKSCGCLNRENLIKSHLEFTNDIDRQLSKRLSIMKSRCYNKNISQYQTHGARGVTICDEWLKDKWAFIKWAKDNGFKTGYTIERKNEGIYKKNQDGPYAPWNCLCIPPSEQPNNTRKNRFLCVFDHNLTITQWGRVFNGNPKFFYGHYSDDEIVQRLKQNLFGGSMTVLQNIRMRITEARNAYWHSKPIISDREYDKLIISLSKLSPNDSLLHDIESETLEQKPVQHIRHMYSLGKVYTWGDLVKWAISVARSDDERFLIQPKYDGMSIEFIVNSNFGGRMVTRGNGDVGNDVTDHSSIMEYVETASKTTDGIVNLCSRPVTGMFNSGRGRDICQTCELVVTRKNFDRLKDKFRDADYKSCRNMASGLLNSKMTDEMRNLGYVCTLINHNAYSIEVTLRDIKSHCRDYESEVMNFGGIATDGTVFKLADSEYSDSLGYTEHHPRGQIALKMSMREADVVVKKIIWQVGENHVTPVCEFDPVVLDDAEINRVTAHGKDFFVSNNICIGSTLTIIRQGGVIPKIIDVTTPAGLKCEVPTVCPDCGQKLREEGAFLSCTNDECSSRIACKIVRGLNILGLKGVGPSLALKVIGEMYIPNIMVWAQEISELRAAPELWNEKWLKRQTKFTASELATLVKLTDLMKTGVTASTLLKSVCIPEVGDMFVNAINKYAGGVVKLMSVVPVDRMYDYLVDRDGVNGDALRNFMIWQELHHEEFVEYMNLFTIIPETAQCDGIADSEGCVCFTGAGPKPRHELEVLAKQMGFAVTDNANVCGVLVCADPKGNSSKLKKARAKNKLILSYEEFFKGKL